MGWCTACIYARFPLTLLLPVCRTCICTAREELTPGQVCVVRGARRMRRTRVALEAWNKTPKIAPTPQLAGFGGLGGDLETDPEAGQAGEPEIVYPNRQYARNKRPSDLCPFAALPPPRAGKLPCEETLASLRQTHPRLRSLASVNAVAPNKPVCQS